jgi:hypothetical protein
MSKFWFRARSYGWGWTPASVEGWLVTLVFLAALAAVTVIFVYQVRGGVGRVSATLQFLLAVAILTGLLLAIAWLTGERPHWRWGG